MTAETPRGDRQLQGDALETSQPGVLLAEDDEALRTLLAWVLADEGFRVTECRHGIELLDCLGASISGDPLDETFDLIISDIRMPGISGLTFLEGIGGRPGFPPIILITAFGDRETHERAGELGAAAVLDKPFTTIELLRSIRNVLQKP